MSVVTRAAAPFLRLPGTETRDVSVERDLAAKMPDGAVLLADRWFPSRPRHPSPTVLIRTPYGRKVMGALGRLFAERGYQVLIQSCRATFGSEGDWHPLRNEQADGHATLDWVATQPWFDGRLVMWGASYLGMTQWAVAEEPPPILAAMAMAVTASNMRDGLLYPGGSFSLEMALGWTYQIAHQELGFTKVWRSQLAGRAVLARAADVLPLGKADAAALGRPVPVYQDWLAHDAPGDPWWDPIDFSRHPDRVPPTSMVGGWYDLFLPAQVADYERLRRAGRSARLTIGPWHHSSPGLFGEAIRDALSWFGSQLGQHGTPDERAPVRVYVLGSERWEEFSLWPPAGTEQRWYLGRSGTLSRSAPAAERNPDRYHYNPHDPTPAVGGPSFDPLRAGRKDQRRRESRRDVLTYTSPVLTEDLTVVGPLAATLHVRSSLGHTDFFVRLCDVDSKGRSVNLSDGIIRVTPGSFARDPDGVCRLEVALWPTAATFRAGHRIRLQVSSGAHPLYARNPGTGQPLATGSDLRGADQEIFSDVDRPSFIALPTVPLFGSRRESGRTPRLTSRA
jgi:putative CocE/NonD family hydrolase